MSAPTSAQQLPANERTMVENSYSRKKQKHIFPFWRCPATQHAQRTSVGLQDIDYVATHQSLVFNSKHTVIVGCRFFGYNFNPFALVNAEFQRRLLSRALQGLLPQELFCAW